METELKIKIKTSFNKIVSADENGFATTEDITEYVERKFHKYVEKIVSENLENSVFEEHHLEGFLETFGVEGWDDLKDYGEIKMEVLQTS